MPLLSRKRILLAKIETTYGTDSSPVAANAMLIRNLDMTPLDAEIVSRDLVRPYFGNYDQIIASQKVGLTFEVELQSSGTAGVAPSYGPLLRACGLSETTTAAGQPQATSTGDALAQVQAQLASERKARITETVTRRAENKITNDKLQWWINAAMTDEAGTLAQIDALPVARIGSEPVGPGQVSIGEPEVLAGFGAKPTPTVENIFKAHTTPQAR